MGAPVELGRACKLCGSQIELQVQTDGGYYTDDLEALLDTSINDTILVEIHCDCPRPRSVTLQAADARKYD